MGPAVESISPLCFPIEGGDCIIDETVKEGQNGCRSVQLAADQLDVLVRVRLLSLAYVFLGEMSTDYTCLAQPQVYFKCPTVLFVPGSSTVFLTTVFFEASQIGHRGV